MLHSITVAKLFTCSMIMLVLIMSSTTSLVDCKALFESNSLQEENLNSKNDGSNSRQFLFLTGNGRETSASDFIRLAVMRFIYGLATNMGLEERLEGLFNGAFVPPNADSDLFGLSGFDDSAVNAGIFDEGALGAIFDDDAF